MCCLSSISIAEKFWAEESFNVFVHCRFLTSAGNVSYYNDTEKIQSLITELNDTGYIQEGTFANWNQAYIEWLKTERAKQVGYYKYEFEWMYGEFLVF